MGVRVIGSSKWDQVAAVSYHDTVNDLQGLTFSGGGPFARLAWFELLEAFGSKPLIALVRDKEEALALPLVRTNGALEPLTNWYAFTWQDLATDRADREQMLADLARDLSGKAHRIVLDKLSDEAGSATRCEAAFRAAGWFVAREVCDSNHVLHVRGRDYSAYLASRPGPLRTTLKRKAKKVSVVILTRFDVDAWHSYEEVYAASWKPGEGDPALLRRFAEREGDAGRLRLGLARHEGRVVAAQFWTVDGTAAYIHKLAHLESARPLSAGTTLTAALFKHTIDRDRVTLVDFGTGDDAYKRDWMDAVRPRFRLTCLRPERPGNWPAIAKALLRKLVSRTLAG